MAIPPSGPALIFDLDGTLVDTAPDLLGATNAVLLARDRPPLDGPGLRHMVGFGAHSLITQAMQASGPGPEAADMPALLDIFLAHYTDHIADFSRPFLGVPETLDALKARGARLGILTNKPQSLTDLLLPRLALDGYFAAAYGAGRKDYTKPDPRIFDDVATELGGRPAVMIGDSITDLKTGRAAGVPVILLSYGYTPVPAAALGADIVLDDFTALPQALEQLGLL